MTDCAIVDDSAIADEDAIAERAAMQDGSMADYDVAADCQWPTVRIKVAGMGDVQNCIVLNVGACPNADAMDVAANDGARPY